MPAALKKLHDRENGFTLIELLIVVLIVGILAAIAIPVYLGIQTQGYKSAVKSDVNLTVKRVQVGVTEGKTITQIRADQTSYKQQSVKGEVVDIRASANGNAGADDFSVQGIVTKNSTPVAGPINYGYFYDSVTGKFTESDDALALGSSFPTIAIATGSLPNGNANTAYSATINSVVTNPGGPTTYAATGLPSTLTLDASSGVISGTPTGAGTYTVVVTATSGGINATKTYTLNVYDKPSISTTSLTSVSKGTSSPQTIAATGNPAPTFTVTAGALPDGMNLSTAGVLSGAATASGSFSFTVTASNAGGTDAKAYSLIVNDAPAVTTTALPDATVNSDYNYTVTATGYPTPTIAVTNLPSGLAFDPSTNKITGTPNASAGASAPSVKIVATNTISSDTKNLPMTVNAIAPTITSTGFPSGKVGNSYSATLTSSNGTGSVTWAKSSGTLPPGLSLNSTTGIVSGTPTGNYADYTFGVTATASGKTSAERTYTLKIAQDINISNSNVELGNTSQWYSYWTVSNSTNANFTATSSNSHSGSWSEYFKTLNNNGYIQGLLYCPGVAYQAGTRVRWTAYVSGIADPAWTGTTQYPLHIFSRANNWDGWGSSDVTVNGAGDWHQVALDFTPDGNTGNLCFGATVSQNSSADYFKQMWVDDVTLTLGG